MTLYLYLLNIWSFFAPVQHHVADSSIYPALEFLRQKMSVFCLQQHFYIFHVGIVCCSRTASSKWRTERTMPICSIVPQVPHYVLYIILLQTQKELSCNNVFFLFVFKLNKSRFQITLGVFSFCLQCEVKFHHELRFLV